MFESLMKVASGIKNAIIGPLCAPNDFLCKLTDGRWSLPEFITSPSSSPLGRFVVASGFAIGAIGLSFASYTGLYQRKRKKPTKMDTMLVGSAEQFTSFTGAVLVLGSMPVLEEAPYYLSRFGAQEAVNPTQSVPKDLKSFIFDRIKDLNITALIVLTMNGIKSIFPFKGFFSTVFLGSIKKVISGIFNRTEDKLISEDRDNTVSVFDANKIMKDALKGVCLYATLDLSLRIFSDYLIDGDHDPEKYSQLAFIVSGVVGELVYQYGLKKAEDFFTAPSEPKRISNRHN